MCPEGPIKIPPAPAEKHINLLDRPERPFSNQFHPAAEFAVLGAVIVHLSRKARFLGQFVKGTSLVRRDCQRFLGENRFARPKRGRGNVGVGMVRCGHDHGVDFIGFFIEQTTEIRYQRGRVFDKFRVVLFDCVAAFLPVRSSPLIGTLPPFVIHLLYLPLIDIAGQAVADLVVVVNSEAESMLGSVAVNPHDREIECFVRFIGKSCPSRIGRKDQKASGTGGSFRQELTSFHGSALSF